MTGFVCNPASPPTFEPSKFLPPDDICNADRVVSCGKEEGEEKRGSMSRSYFNIDLDSGAVSVKENAVTFGCRLCSVTELGRSGIELSSCFTLG